MLDDMNADYAAGLLQAVVSELQSEYQPLPPSPPSSTASPSLPPQSHPYLSSPPDSSHEDEVYDEGPRSASSSLGKHSRTGRLAEVVSMLCGGGLQLHVLPSGGDVADLIPSITRDFFRAGTPTSDITQQMIDAEVQGAIPSQKCLSAALTASSPAAQPTARLAACSSATASLAVAVASATSGSGAARVPLLASSHHRDLVGFSPVAKRRTSADTDSLQPAPASITPTSSRTALLGRAPLDAAVRAQAW